MQMAEIFGATIVDVTSEVLVIEMTGTREKVGAFIDLAGAVRDRGTDAHRPFGHEPGSEGDVI